MHYHVAGHADSDSSDIWAETDVWVSECDEDNCRDEDDDYSPGSALYCAGPLASTDNDEVSA